MNGITNNGGHLLLVPVQAEANSKTETTNIDIIETAKTHLIPRDDQSSNGHRDPVEV